MDERDIQEAVESLRQDRRGGMAADEALAAAVEAYGLPLIALRNRYRLRYSQDIEETPPAIQPVELPTIRSSRIKEARRIAHQCHREKKRYLDPAFAHLNGTISKIGRYEFVFAGIFLQSRYILAVIVDDYVLSGNEVLPGPFVMRQEEDRLAHYIDAQPPAT